MSEPKTKVNEASVIDFINTIDGDVKRKDSLALLKLYSDVTGEPAKMWGTSIVGFGMFHSKSERSSQEGDWPLAAFSPRKQSLTLYFDGFENCATLLEKLGKHKTSKACLYINKLADVDQAVLKELVGQSFEASKQRYGS
jgi:hypothetical protein